MLSNQMSNLHEDIMISQGSINFNVHQFLTQLEKCEATNSMIVKKDHIEEIKDNVVFYEVAKQVFNQYITYGVKIKLPAKPDVSTWTATIDGRYLLSDWSGLTSKLNNRALSGNAAREAVSNFLIGIGNPWVAYWFAKFLNKEFVRGVGDSVIKSFHPELVVKFKIQKAMDYLVLDLDNPSKDVVENPVDFSKGDWVAEPKMDGFRCLMVWENGTFIPYTSNGNRHYNCDNIISELIASGFAGRVVDGELLATDWNSTSSIVTTEAAHPKRDLLQFHIFDTITLEDWVKEESSTRLGISKSVISKNLLSGFQHLVEVPMKMVRSVEDVRAAARGFFQQGFEGAVVKDLHSFYSRNGKEDGRVEWWKKAKFWKTFDYKIIAVTMSTDSEKEYNRKISLKSGVPTLLAESITLDISGTPTNCGGLTDEWREYYTVHKDEVIGHYAEVKFQRNAAQFVSKSLRFPSHIRYRSDK